MIKYLLIFVLFALFATSFAEETSDVIVLTDDNFEEEIKKYEYVLVEFYAPWCGHCKTLAPEYEKAATDLKGVAHLAKFDADSNRKTGEKYQVKGFPTIKLFRNGNFYKDFDGGRKADQIVAWMKKKTGPTATPLNSQTEIDAFVAEHSGKAIIGYFTEKEELKKFLDVIVSDKVFEDFAAAEVHDKTLVHAAGEKSIHLHRSFDASTTFKGDFSGLKEFVVSNGYPLVEEIGQLNFQRFVDSGLHLAVAFLDYKQVAEKEAQIKTLEKVASALKGKFSFTFSDGVEYKEQYESMGGDATKLPGLAAMNIEKRINFPYTGEFLEGNIESWAKGILDGSIKPFFKSDPVPEKNDEAVFVVVGKNFEAEVLDETKDVLLEYYAPWCGHCKTLEPRYTKIAEFLKDVKTLRLAKVDATTNDTPVSVEGFPTIFFFPKGNKSKPIQFEGPRTEKGILSFLQENAVASKAEIATLSWTKVDEVETAVETETEATEAKEEEKEL